MHMLRKKADLKTLCTYNSIYMAFWKRQINKDRNQVSGGGGVGGGFDGQVSWGGFGGDGTILYRLW